MTTHKYSSFEEIDEKLKILKLETEIDKESFKFDVLNFKKNISSTLFSGGISSLVQITILSFVTKKLSKILGKQS
ncbi:DUF6327 family protein [Flaviramulus sp. BrNp1-15]|uniref:DUF6327 family protein n=1 Tax=Flaviramulus sp. BrNp1-15 TaxID=2916754 RepID=UPI001EE8F749|nr:DUF6327 family protein [Flaviramulus sp. BrNp1-15]ULC58141.1 DUF6327 family protein [Flaviramulus sp. BrNp1-15]